MSDDQALAQASHPRKLRIGIWAVYQTPEGAASLFPDEGIGVFALNLVRGMVELDDAPQVVVLTQSDAVKVYRDNLPTGRCNLEFITPDTHTPWRERLARRILDVGDWLGQLSNRGREAKHHLLGWLWERAKGIARPLVRKARQKHPGALLALALSGVVVVPVGWVLYAGAYLTGSIFHVAVAPARWAIRVFRRVAAGVRKPAGKGVDWSALARKADCDVWVAPSHFCNHPADLPCSVFFLHDFVTHHYPDLFPKEYVERVDRTVRRRVRQATVVACMSASTRDRDLKGALDLPDDKVRMVRTAIPLDFPDLTAAQARERLPAPLRRPFLLYPTAFRPYKNHAGLIHALRRLRDEHGITDFDLVFTGTKTPPDDIVRLPRAFGLEDHVHVLGPVSRADLAALYQCAYATIVPSRFEQGSYQIAEALHFNCPAACSDIAPFREQCGPMGDAMIYFDPDDPAAIADAILAIRADRDGVRHRQKQAATQMLSRTWGECAREWVEVFREAHQKSLQAEANPNPVSERVPSVALFLGWAYQGGVWELVQMLMHGLVEVNRRRKQLDLTLLVHPDQQQMDLVESLQPELRLGHVEMQPMAAFEAAQVQGDGWRYPAAEPPPIFTWLNEANNLTHEADAWFALTDRFLWPLLPARSYGVWVYDVIQHHLPHVFGEGFMVCYRNGMIPTLHNADVIVTGSPSTEKDAAAALGLSQHQQRLIPLACAPQDRFAALTSQHVSLPREPFILNVANAAPHKGARVLFQALARLKARLKERTPLLVQCGVRCEQFSASTPLSHADPHYAHMRQLITDLGLIEGEDVVFLGFVTDAEVLDLYQRCRVVVNAAAYDNGSFNLIEGHYFGRPLVTTDYPAARDLVARFDLPVRYYPVDDDAGLCAALLAALSDPVLSGEQLAQVRKRLIDPEFSYRRQAERFYDVLVELGRSGRLKRTGEVTPQLVAPIETRRAA